MRAQVDALSAEDAAVKYAQWAAGPAVRKVLGSASTLATIGSSGSDMQKISGAESVNGYKREEIGSEAYEEENAPPTSQRNLLL